MQYLRVVPQTWIVRASERTQTFPGGKYPGILRAFCCIIIFEVNQNCASGNRISVSLGTSAFSFL